MKNYKFFQQLLDTLPDPLPGTSLLETSPKISKEWHPTKNGKLTPDKVTSGSSIYVWWICNKNHEWKIQINARKSRNCPYCSNQKIGYGNDLVSVYPEIAKQWSKTKNKNVKPNEVLAGGKSVYWWQCNKGHQFQSSLEHKIKLHNSTFGGCPYCSGKKIGYGNDLKSQNPTLAKEWNYEKNNLKPSDVMPHSGKKYWWICKKKHEWQTSPDKRSRGRGCPFCNRKRIPKNERAAIIAQINNLHNKGLSMQKISEKINYSATTVYKLLKEQSD